MAPTPSAAEAVGSEAVQPDDEPQALVVTHWFDSGEGDGPYRATVRLVGRRIGVHGKPREWDSFVHEDTVDPVLPGTGPVCVTSTVHGVARGQWSVTGEVIRTDTSHVAAGRPRGSRIYRQPVQRAAWSWRRWRLGTAPADEIPTRWALTAPLARIPAVIPGSYTALFVVGVLVALTLQLTILQSEQIAVPRSAVVSVLALTAGLIGAKLWYAFLHPTESVIKGGWAVDGFLVTAPSVAMVALIVFGIPVGAFLDAATPGMFLAVAIGRVGCFLTGCCAGRVTASRWGVWSSDRRVGARRIPTQLIESGTGAALGILSLPVVLLHIRPAHGAVFVVAMLVYLVVRQRLIRLRAESRRHLWERRQLVIEPR